MEEYRKKYDKDKIESQIRNFFAKGGPLSRHLDGYEPRSAQVQMALAVRRTLDEDGNLIVEAGTGTGKTLAYLVPSLAAGKRIVVSTGTKNLQEQLFFKDIPFLMSMGGSFKAAVMKGRGNYLCLRKQKLFKHQPLLKGIEEVDYFRIIEEWSARTNTGDFAELTEIPDGLPLLRQLSCSSENCTGRSCPLYENCWLVKMRSIAAEADVVIVNHHLLFADMSVREGGFGAVIPEYDRVILDEAHDVEHVATSYFGVEISNWRFEELVRDSMAEFSQLKLDDSEFAKRVTDIGNRAVKLFKSIKPETDRFSIREVINKDVEDRFQKLHDALHSFESHIGTLSNAAESLHLLGRRAVDLRESLQMVLDLSKTGYVYWGEKRGRGIFLKASPIDVASFIRTSLFEENKCTILTSATLTVENSFDYFRTRVGIDEGEELQLDSHFDYRKQTRLYVPMDLPEPNAREFLDKAVEEMARLLELTSGRAFVLCTSLRNMEKSFELLKDRVSFPLLMQGTKSRQELMRLFREKEGSILLASASFWQGIDVRGPDLSLVIIDKLPFAVPDDPLISARIEQIKDEGGNPFMQLQVPSAALTLKQGLGRLIRSIDDRGIMAVLDSRLLKKFYGSVFIRSLHGSPVLTKFALLKNWWKQTSGRD